ncbi:hypothetical protein C1I92_27785 [Jiangella anatolica]|uniref:Uncharacterized protein n=1 Tax=Jiangella anatolica TaxID=2670374 RepID=A0A2W2C2U2_9ACTN|nr:hypothetical protein C1I92_27785 [Jiangella anatolica]
MRDYLWAAVPILLVASLWIYVGYAWGVMGNETFCEERSADVVSARRDLLPLDFTCEYADGSVYRYVPDAAKAAMYGALAGAVACFATATALGRRADATVGPGQP